MAHANYFAHDLAGAGITWQKNIQNFGYTGTTIGENIAAGASSAAETFKQWKNSPAHNANMLDPSFNAIGIGRAFTRTSTYNWYWTTDFGNTVDASAPTCSPDPVYVPVVRSSASYCPDAEETAVLGQINSLRSGLSLPALVIDQRLGAAADYHAADMAATGQFSLNLSTGTWRNNIYDFGYDDPNAVGAAFGSGLASSIFSFLPNTSMTSDAALVVGIGRVKSNSSNTY